jgi:hypothetical protein
MRVKIVVPTFGNLLMIIEAASGLKASGAAE